MTVDFTDLPDLAGERVGGAAVACNDEFFAAKENLLRAGPAEWREHEHTDRGKWMDGWETRRRRGPGHDWCVVRLGLPGVIRGVVVDTKWFRGNFPESASLDAAHGDGPWHEILPRSLLRGDDRNLFPIVDPRRFTRVRLNIYPDGGVARLRVHGEVAPDWPRLLALGGPIDLAALENGGRVLSASDMFFGSRGNLILPGRPLDMSDGWETKRRRGPGDDHDWAIVRLGATGTAERVEIDTTHFKGNAPDRCTLEGANAADGPWRPLLAAKLAPHTRHVFDAELRRIGAISHVRLAVFPDGGVARLRVWGEVERPPVGRLNALPRPEAVAALAGCCGSRRWAEAMADRRPFEDLPALLHAGERVFFGLGEADWLEAFAAHPRIGERGGSCWSADEQAGTASAGAEALADLAAKNRAYEERFGFVFLVCATGKGAPEMLALLEERLGAPREAEIRTAAEEQAHILRLRLRRWVKENP
ncbi:MAG TPA: allantoicase [Haliangiales bacterium]|nr:allantoicase [Haliangiales bacterium]